MNLSYYSPQRHDRAQMSPLTEFALRAIPIASQVFGEGAHDVQYKVARILVRHLVLGSKGLQIFLQHEVAETELGYLNGVGVAIRIPLARNRHIYKNIKT